METAEFNYQDFDPTYQNEADKQLLVRFYVKSVQDKSLSNVEGRPIFNDKEYIEIRVPGKRDAIARPASHDDKQRFPRHYAAFQQRIEMPAEGTPLAEWPAISRSMADQFAFVNVKTVEQLADLNDSTIDGKIPGAQTLKQRAKDWLDATKDDSVLSQLRTELEERDATILQMSVQMDVLSSKVDELMAADDEPKQGSRGKKT